MKKAKLKISFNAPVVLGFAFICLIATILGIVTGGAANTLVFSTYRSSFLNPLTYIRAIGHVFGHSGWSHFFNNMCYILLLGPILEEKYGQKKICIVILITAVATAIINAILSPNALLGASGVVFAFIVLVSFTGFKDGEIPLTFILVALIYIGQQVFQGIFTNDNVSQMGHIIGGAVGAVVGYCWNRKG
ncbi:MAG: rhomboid family intramembrane serine protease [Lachnospiraceae bacterium]|nr:rhomboid family intramembrane serine protease [Lachnospiraceae bacterium]